MVWIPSACARSGTGSTRISGDTDPPSRAPVSTPRPGRPAPPRRAPTAPPRRFPPSSEQAAALVDGDRPAGFAPDLAGLRFSTPAVQRSFLGGPPRSAPAIHESRGVHLL